MRDVESRQAASLARDGEAIEGLANFTEEQAAKVHGGAALAPSAAAIMWECLRLGIGFSCENPLSSRLWEWPEMQERMQDTRAFLVDFVYGAAWKKPTRFVTSVNALRRLASLCSPDHVHQPLRGVSPCGLLWAKLACPYPPLLCSAYASALADGLRGFQLQLWRTGPATTHLRGRR